MTDFCRLHKDMEHARWLDSFNDASIQWQEAYVLRLEIKYTGSIDMHSPLPPNSSLRGLLDRGNIPGWR